MREKHGLRYPKDERVWFHYCRHMVEEALGVDDGSEIAEEMWKTDFHETELLPDGLEAVESSNMQGYLVMIISNWEAPTLHDICERLGISKHVDLILPSRDAESAKPDSVIFEMALSKLKVRPDETVHIGDSFGCDVIGARSAGMTPIHLATEEETPSDFMGISVNNILDALGEVGRMTQR
jgi:HAD superfamily hydrolase (TIGR01549 family)